MNSRTKQIVFVGAITLLFGCGASQSSKEKRYSDEAMADSTSAPSAAANKDFTSSSAAVENNKDTTRRFIRTADLKFKVKNVIKATYSIEDITRSFDGFVTYTNLYSTIDNRTVIPVTADSSLETTYYTVQNEMTLRVPNVKLDTTLKTVASLIDFLDYRIIKADDVALQLLTNQMTQSRVGKHEERLTNAIDNRGKKLGETTNAEENLLNKQEQSDNAKIANLSLKDQINFSTIKLSIYQRQSIRTEMIASNKNVEPYEPNFGLQLKDSVKLGWDMLEGFFVFIVKLWGLIVVGIATFILLRMIVNKYMTKK